MRANGFGVSAIAILIASVFSSSVNAKPAQTSAVITRTEYGIPHVRANDFRGIGYGVGYSYAQDNLCMLAEEFVTLSGQRSQYFGPKGMTTPGFDPVDNLTSDIFFRASIDLETLRAGLNTIGDDTLQLMQGYVAGYNRYIREIGANGAPEACRGKPWLRQITIDDMLRLSEKQAMLAGSLALLPAIANAAPPNVVQMQKAAENTIELPEKRETGFGSNAWAFGKEVTENGRGVLVGNPHFPWNGTSRFYQMHITIPGVIDVMGAGLGGTPIPQIGFNQNLAWSHTVTASRHFTIFELKLDPKDPTSYSIDNNYEKMGVKTIVVPMNDGAAPVVRTLYTTRYGPVLSMPQAGMAWNSQMVFSVRDANRNNQRLLPTWIKIGKARDVMEILSIVENTLGIPWVNTIAADKSGNALLADITAVPNVSAQKISACSTPRSVPLSANLILLDGSRSECNWDIAAGTPVQGLMPAADQAVFLRNDYVANSNDSYWLTNPKEPHSTLSPILGPTKTERSLRTRSGLTQISRRLNGQDDVASRKISQSNVGQLIFANKSLAVELTLDKLLTLCADQGDVKAACDVLSKWDRRFNTDSQGAYLFMTFWSEAKNIPNKWVVPFDANDPVNTPRDLKTDGEIGFKLLGALRNASAQLAKENIALDAPWGTVQYAIRGNEKIPIHGGAHELGILNMQMSDKSNGALIPRHGTSYIQIVGFDENGPIADAILSYSQSTDPASPFYGDQTKNYSIKKWNHLPFTPAQIERAKIRRAITIRE